MNDSPATTDSLRFMPQLDGLRAIAILAVLWAHWMPEYTAQLPWGHFGVQLFFVLSGFLITRILLAAKPETGIPKGPVLSRFYIRRALRIFPAYYTVLCIAWLANCSDIRATILWHASYMTNMYIFFTKNYSNLSHFWSLSVEEHFYLIWPWVVLWSSRRMLVQILIGMIIGTPILLYALVTFLPQFEPTVLMPVAGDALGIGALLAAIDGHPAWKVRLFRIQWMICLPIFLVLQFRFHLTGESLPWAAETIRKTAMVISFSAIVSQAAIGYQGAIG